MFLPLVTPTEESLQGGGSRVLGARLAGKVGGYGLITRCCILEEARWDFYMRRSWSWKHVQCYGGALSLKARAPPGCRRRALESLIVGSAVSVRHPFTREECQATCPCLSASIGTSPYILTRLRIPGGAKLPNEPNIQPRTSRDEGSSISSASLEPRANLIHL